MSKYPEKIDGVVSFSDYFSIDPARTAKLAVFDPLLDIDLPFAIDPKLLDDSNAPELTGAYEDILLHFRSIISLVSASQTPDDKCWREAESRLDFHEFKGPCLGFSDGSAAGRGWGSVTRRQVLRTLKDIVTAGLIDPHLFELLGVFEDNIGADLISDMIGTILRPRLCEYTKRVAGVLGVATKPVVIDGKTWQLPTFRRDNSDKDTYLILVPEDILSEMPVALDRRDVPVVAGYNERVRQELNSKFGSDWHKIVIKKKSAARDALLTDANVLRKFVERYDKKEAVPYDFSSDPKNQRLWYSVARAFLDAGSPPQLSLGEDPSNSDVVAVVMQIIAAFKRNVEHNELYLSFYNDDGSPRNERIIQRTFQAVARAYCEANNLDLAPETNAGRGPVDFKMSRGVRRVLVEFKRSGHHRLLHGFRKQLSAYEQAEGSSPSIYVIIDQGDNDSAVSSVVEEHSRSKAVELRCPDLVVIESWKHESGSRA